MLRGLKDKDVPFVCLDGTLVHTDRVAERDPDTGYHLWYSGKYKAPHAATYRCLPTTLADKGYTGAGIGVKTPIKGSKPDTGARSYNQVQASLRAPA